MEQPSVQPHVDAAVRALRPDFRAISIVARGISNGDAHPFASKLFRQASEELSWAPWADAHVEAWRDTFRAFGAKPKRTPSSVDALRSRVAKTGELPSINPVVDIYNAVSVKFALPVGGEDLEAYSGQPRLVRASGTETFDTTRDGTDVAEAVDEGEVIWRDDRGATCRRWNWRQCNRTRIIPGSSTVWFILEALEPMPDEALTAAATLLCDSLAAISPSATFSVDRL